MTNGWLSVLIRAEFFRHLIKNLTGLTYVDRYLIFMVYIV